MAIQKFNGRAGFSINHPPVDLIDNVGNYTTTTGNITAVGGTYTGDVSASHFFGDFIGELQVDCKNTSGSIIPKGTPVYITGTVGATNVLEVAPADAGNSTKMPAIGLTSEELLVNGTGHVTYLGVLQGLNTNTYTVGQTVYVAVGGGLTNVKPTGTTELIQNIGRVGRVNTNNGEIIVSGSGRTNDVPNTISISGPLTVGGNLTVNGTTTTINSTVTTIDDPIITLGGDTAPTLDDNKDRGIEFRWHNGTTAKLGFFGFDDSTGKFTFMPDATNTNEVFSGSLGTIDVNSVHINGSQIEASNLSNGTTGTGSIVLATSPTLVTPTLGVATATSINKVNITAPTTSSTLTIANGKTLTVNNTLTFTGTDSSSVAFNSGGTVAYTGGKLSQFASTTSAELAGVISDETGTGKLVFDTSPTLVTPNIGAATATSISGTNLAINDITNSVTTFGPSTSGNTYLTIDSNLGESILAGGSLAAIVGNAGISLVDYGGGITLDSSTGFSIGDVSGATSGEYLFIDPSGYTANFNGISVIAPLVSSTNFTSTVSGVDISYGSSATVTTTATTQINLVQLEKTSYRGAKFIIQAVNTTGGKYQLTEINAIHNGNTTVSTATISDINIGGANATYTVDIGGVGSTRMRLRATPTSTQSTVFKVYIRNFSI